MKAGDVVLASLGQADGLRKLRPALLVCQMPPFNDWLSCGISSQVRHQVPDFDELISTEQSDFTDSGLRVESIVRLGFVGTLAETDIGGVLGHVSPERLQRLRRRFAHHLHPTPAQ